MKIHMKRNSRQTWCGRRIKPGWPLASSGATCKTCLKADHAEQLRNAQ